MKICAISDLHGFLPKVPECDILLIAGDVCPYIRASRQLTWLRHEFKEWLETIKVPVFGIAGNHDWPMQRWPYDVEAIKLPWTYLKDSGAEHEQFKIYGTPWTSHYPEENSWAFTRNEEELSAIWGKIPVDTDILISHGPPLFFGDLTTRGNYAGSISLTKKILEISPKLVIFGHIHEARGSWNYNRIKFANVSLSNAKHKPGFYEPCMFEVNK